VIPWFALATDLATLTKRLEKPAGLSDNSFVRTAQLPNDSGGGEVLERTNALGAEH